MKIHLVFKSQHIRTHPQLPFLLSKLVTRLIKKKASEKMQASSSTSLPLCVSGITRRLTLSNEMVDHDRRRRAMKRQRSLSTAGRWFDSSGEMRLQRRDVPIRGVVVDGGSGSGSGSGSGGQSGGCHGLSCAARAA